ncbi:MAG TPA: hypothetical protein VGP68_09325, partial [Gemmataceae bacterium]|nr:hypothetical protein [Gemmataceae bacterium]
MLSSPEILETCHSPGAGIIPRRRWLIYRLTIVLATSAWVGQAQGDDAVLLDGTRRPGQLRFRDEKFEIVLAGQTDPLPWQQVDRVDLSAKNRLPPAPPFWWQATLTNGDRFACHLLEVESNAIICDSSWFQGLRVRRNVVRAFDRPLGWAPWLRQDFFKEARGWKESRVDGESPPTLGLGGLTLSQPSKMLQYTPDAPLPFGKIVLLLKDATPTPGRRWQLRLGIDGDGTFQSIKVLFGSHAPVEMQAPGLKIAQQEVSLTDSGILLEMEIRPASLQVSANDRLAAWMERGFRVALLRSLSLEPAEARKGDDPLAKLILQEFAVARRLEPLPRPPAHADLDEIWLESGDQIFGSYRLLNRDFLELATVREPRRIPCSQLRGLYPKQVPARAGLQPAPWRLTLIDPGSAEPSQLTGMIRTWGEREIVMLHPLLGELKIPRSQIQSVAQAIPRATDFR